MLASTFNERGILNIVNALNKKDIKMPEIRPIKATQEVIIVIGDSGGDGGSLVITPNGVIKVPSNNPEGREAFNSLVKSYAKLKEIALKQKSI